MKRNAVLLTAMLAALLVLPAIAHAATTITFLGLSDEVNRAKYEALIADFEAANPDIKVEAVWGPGAAEPMFEQIAVMTAGGVAPDVFWVHSYLLVDAVKAGFIRQLDDLMAKDPHPELDEYYPASFNDYRYDGKLWGVPRGVTTVALYYNTDLFDQRGLGYPDASWTWETLVDAAQKLTHERNGRTVYGLMPPTNHGPDLTVVWQNEGSVLSEDRSRSMMGSPATVEAYQWIADLIHVHGVAPGPTDLASWDWAALDRGDVAMLYQIPSITGLLSDDISWDLAELPKGKVQATRTASSGHAIHRQTQNEDAAWKFIKFLSSEHAQRIYATGLEVPPMRSVASSELFLQQKGAVRNYEAFISGLAYARAEQVTQNYFRLIGLKNAALNKIWNQQDSVQGALTMLDQEINAFLAGN